MPYVYRCPQCRAASPPGPRRTAEDYQQQHRDNEHGGLAPDGERIEYVAGSAPHPDGRYVSTGVLIALIVLLVIAETVARLSSR